MRIFDDVEPTHLASCDAVIHAAAKAEAWGTWSDFERVNVEGTRRMLAAAKAAGVERFIHIGTEAALFRGQPMRDIDESYPLAPDSPFPYSATKARAELAVREADDHEKGWTTLVLRPRLVWGPGDETVCSPAFSVWSKPAGSPGSTPVEAGPRLVTSTTWCMPSSAPSTTERAEKADRQNKAALRAVPDAT